MKRITFIVWVMERTRAKKKLNLKELNNVNFYFQI